MARRVRKPSRKLTRKKTRKTEQFMKKKLAALFLIVLLALVSLAIRVSYINAKYGREYSINILSQANSKYTSTVVPARRGDIYDRNGNVLATSNKIFNVILDCAEVNVNPEVYLEPTIRALTECFRLEEEKLRDILTSEATQKSQYQVLKTKVTVEEKKNFDAYCSPEDTEELTEEERADRKLVRGIWFEEDYTRVYPNGSLACDTIGFTSARDAANLGLEGYYNSMLSGSDGRKYGYVNSESDLEQTIIQPDNGYNLQTTIDAGIQEIVEKYVDAFQEAMGAANVGVIIEDPSTGEILAMDGGDRYDLNSPRDLSLMYSEEEIRAMNDSETVDALSSLWSNFCVTGSYEPGSVLKPIVVSAALEKGAILETDTFYCDGYEQFGAEGSETMIRCAVYPDTHGHQTLADVIANSCNDGMMQMASRMGAEQFLKSLETYNFGSRTGIDLPNESAGVLFSQDEMHEVELACAAFGQGITVSMIQEISAICAAINGGYYYQPHLVKKITDSEGKAVQTIQPTLLRQTVSSIVSADICSYMKLSVESGTSASSKVQGYSSGGKTGTAEKFPRGDGNYLVSFTGFAPADNPQLVIYVVVDEPNVKEQANSVYAQYIAQGILSEVLPYLNIKPDESSDGTIPTTELWEGFTGHIAHYVKVTVGEDGRTYDAKGNLVDWDGNRIDENGYLLDANGDYQYTEEGYWIRSDALYEPTTSPYQASTANDGSSDTNIPAPAEDEYGDLMENEDNNLESEGLTNEEAGFE